MAAKLAAREAAGLCLLPNLSWQARDCKILLQQGDPQPIAGGSSDFDEKGCLAMRLAGRERKPIVDADYSSACAADESPDSDMDEEYKDYLKEFKLLVLVYILMYGVDVGTSGKSLQEEERQRILRAKTLIMGETSGEDEVVGSDVSFHVWQVGKSCSIRNREARC